MAIVTISRQAGIPGEDIANDIAEDLGFRYLDRKSLETTLSEYGFSKIEMERFDEKKPGFWQILTDSGNRYRHHLKMAVYEFAAEGDCVILGRGGQVLFEDVPGCLRVKVFGRLEDRIRSIEKKHNCDTRHAKQLIANTDHDRSAFHRFLFNIDWEDPCLYDLMINTHLLSKNVVAATIREAFDSSGMTEKRKHTERKLKDLCLAQRAVVKILCVEQMAIRILEVTAENGVVTLRGSASLQEDNINRCEQLVAEISDVKGVINEINFFPPYTGM